MTSSGASGMESQELVLMLKLFFSIMLRTFQNGKILKKNTSSGASAVGCSRTGSGASVVGCSRTGIFFQYLSILEGSELADKNFIF